MISGNSAVGNEEPSPANSGNRLAGIATRRAVRRQRRVWAKRVHSWNHHGSTGLGTVTAAVIAAAEIRPGDEVVDLGCGHGQISRPLAAMRAEVLGVDVSPEMIAQIRWLAERDGLGSLAAIALPIEDLSLPASSVDLVVSSYALHHLRDSDKARLVADAFGWLRPGGRLIVADMMFGRGGSRCDREILRQKVVALARKGPGGWWRMAKNAARYLLRVQERPVSMAAWVAMLDRAGFQDVTAMPIVAEAALVSGLRPTDQGDRSASPPGVNLGSRLT